MVVDEYVLGLILIY